MMPSAAALSFTAGWALNFLGHGSYEKKAPAFADDPSVVVLGRSRVGLAAASRQAPQSRRGRGRSARSQFNLASSAAAHAVALSDNKMHGPVENRCMPNAIDVDAKAAFVYQQLLQEQSSATGLDAAAMGATAVRKLDANADCVVSKDEFVAGMARATRKTGLGPLNRLAEALEVRRAATRSFAEVIEFVLVTPFLFVKDIAVAADVAAAVAISAAAVYLAVAYSFWWLLLLAGAAYFVVDAVRTLRSPLLDDPVTRADKAVEQSKKRDLKALINALPEAALQPPARAGVRLSS